MNDEYVTEPQVILLGCLWGVVLSIVFVFVFSIALECGNETNSDVASRVIETYLTPGYNHVTGNDIFYSSFRELEFEDKSPGASEVEIAFDTVFKSYGNFASYETQNVSDDFIIVRLYGLDGKLDPPLVGFWFKTDSDHMISDWAISRLQPFSRYDEEYAEELG